MSAASRRLLLLAVVLVVVAAAAAAAFAGTVTWGSAIEVPGLAALNAGGGGTEVTSVSCPSSGNCAAGGFYATNPPGQRAFIVSEQAGVWGSAIDVQGLAARNPDPYMSVSSVSCASSGNCAAGGFYADDSSASQAFVVGETNGVWGTATEVAADLNVGGNAQVTSVSCGSTGYCSAVGWYTDGTGKLRAFVVSEKGGKWAGPFDLHPLTAPAADSQATSVSCTGPAACVAGGARSRTGGALLAVETNGKWSRAKKVPGVEMLSAKGAAQVDSVSCTSPGNCAATGWYQRGLQGRFNAFVVTEKNGAWGRAIQVPGLAALNHGTIVVGATSISCSSAGNCALGGSYIDSHGTQRAFVAGEYKGKWARAIDCAGLGYASLVNAVSCASPRNCVAVGAYAAGWGPSDEGPRDFRQLVLAERNGVWSVETIPGTETSGGLWAHPVSVSCVRTGSCAIGGSFVTGSSDPTAFVTAP